ncbi:MAG: nucleotide pyrophosphohydrolase [Patescibacteria group bacterium]
MVNKKYEHIIRKIQKFRDERDWLQFHNPKDVALALSIETSELLELFLWKNKKEIEDYVKDRQSHEEITGEIADIFTFAFELAEVLGIDIDAAIAEKLKKNQKKYPVEKSKGKHTKWTKL